MKEQLLGLLKEHLTIETRTEKDYYSEGIRITIKFDDVEICSDYVATKSDGYY